MAEAIAVVGLISSIASLVDLSSKIMSRISDFTNQTSDIPECFRALASQLSVLAETLQCIESRAQRGRISNNVAQHLQNLLDGMKHEVSLLEEFLAKAIPRTDESRLERSVKALRSLAGQEKVTQAMKKLHSAIQILTFHETTTNLDLSERILQELSHLKLDMSQPQRTFGLCLNEAPQIDPDSFLGRTAELQQLDNWLSLRSDKGKQHQKIISIVGMGGLGKTQLSLAYARQYGDRFSSVFWLSAKDESSLKQSMLTVSEIIFKVDRVKAADTGDEKVRIQRVRKWLSEPWNDNWLLIFDNYDDPALPNVRSSTGFDLRTFFPERTQGSILITTRSPKLTFSQQLSLQKLDDIELGTNILSQCARQDLKHDADAQRLAKRLDGLPLALTIAGTYIRETDTSCTDYLDMYEESWSDLHGPESEPLCEYADRTLFSTWMVSLKQVSQQDADAAELFQFFALLDNEDVWYDLLRAGASNGPPWMMRVTATKIRFDRAIRKLRDYSLIDAVSGSYRVHPCIHDWLLERFLQTLDKSWFLAALSCVHETLPDDKDVQEYFAINRRLVRHVQRLNHKQLQCLWDSCALERGALYASHSFASIYKELDRLGEGEQMYMRSLLWKEKTLGPEDASTLMTAHSLGNLYESQGRLKEAELMLMRALAGQELTLGPGHMSTLGTAHDLGCVFLSQGRLAEAERMFLRALGEKNIAAGAEEILDLDTFQTMDSLGTLYERQGRLTEAEDMYTRALAGKEKACGPDHISTLETLNNLAAFYRHQGKLPKAEQMYTQALAGKQRALGAEHLSTLITVSNFANLYKEQGRFKEAEQMFTQVLAGEEKILGSEHTSTLSTVHNLGSLYHRQDRLVEAEQMYMRALVGKQKALGPDHTSTLRTLHNLAIVYQEQGKFMAAEQTFARELVKLELALGTEHPSVFSTLSSIGTLYQEQDRLSEAEQVSNRVLAGTQKVLGPDHPSTHSALESLAIIYARQGRLTDAEAMYQRALTGIESTLGTEHRAMFTILHNFGTLRHEQKKLVEAEQLYLRALAGREKMFGSDHASTKNTIRMLKWLHESEDWINRSQSS